MLGHGATIKHTGSANAYSNVAGYVGWGKADGLTDCEIDGLMFEAVSASGVPLYMLGNTRSRFRVMSNGPLGSTAGYAYFLAAAGVDCTYTVDVDGAGSTFGLGLVCGFYNESASRETRAIVEGSNIRDTYLSGMSICGVGCKVKGNRVTGVGTSSGSGSGIITVGGNSVDCVGTIIEGNLVEDCAWSGIQQDVVSPSWETGSVFKGNTLNRNGVAGIYLRRSKGTIVEGNTGTDNEPSGISIVENTYDAQVIGNTVEGGTQGIYTLSYTGAEPVDGVMITKNIVRGPSGHGIYTVETAGDGGTITNLRIAENIIRDVGSGSGHIARSSMTEAPTLANNMMLGTGLGSVTV